MDVHSISCGRALKLVLCAQSTTFTRLRELVREDFRKPYMCGMNLNGALKEFLCLRKKLSTCETVDFWLKVGAGVGAFTAVLLVALTCYFWKKNQKLEYKYSKLVMTTNSKECELPAADSCAIMEGEDNEEEVVYSNKQSLLGKLKSLATKEKEDRFESVQLKSSRPPNI